MRKIALYSGRFQPFHPGHYGVYQHLVDKFGKENVFITTSNKIDVDTSPFSFVEKLKIITTMFDINKKNVALVRQPYKPEELLKEFDPKETAVIFVTGEKDGDRLKSGEGIMDYHDSTDLNGFDQSIYVYRVPPQAGGISASFIRTYFSTQEDEEKLKMFFSDVYGKFVPEIFDLFKQRLADELFEYNK